jgi:hypothetical protein
LPLQAQLIGEEPRFALCRQLLTLYSQINIFYTPARGFRQIKLRKKCSAENLKVENLAKIAKVHFRTALRAQGLPEPPKTEWRQKG